LFSPAMRSPRRPWNASSTASFTSLVSAGSAVWLSNGRMATVLMLGRPPPLKPYRHPASARASELAAPAPPRRIEHHRHLHPTDGGRTMPSAAHTIRTAGTSERKFFSGSAHTVVSPTTSAAPAPQLNGPA